MAGSIPAGLIIFFLITLDGSILVFQDEIQEMANPNAILINQLPEWLLCPLDSLIPVSMLQLVDNKLKDIALYSMLPIGITQWGLAEGFRFTAYVNPYTGKLSKFINSAKVRFFLGNVFCTVGCSTTLKNGKMHSIGIATLMFIVNSHCRIDCLVSETVEEKQIHYQTKKGRKRLFYDLHNVLGAMHFFSCLFRLLPGQMVIRLVPEWGFNSLAPKLSKNNVRRRPKRENGKTVKEKS